MQSTARRTYVCGQCLFTVTLIFAQQNEGQFSSLAIILHTPKFNKKYLICSLLYACCMGTSHFGTFTMFDIAKSEKNRNWQHPAPSLLFQF
jgi:hypothetical protein